MEASDQGQNRVRDQEILDFKTQRYAFEENWYLRDPDAAERSGSRILRIDRKACVCERTIDYANGTEAEVHWGEPWRGDQNARNESCRPAHNDARTDRQTDRLHQ